MSNDERPPLVSAEDWAATPPAVQQSFLALVDMVRTLTAEVEQLRAQVKDLQARLQQTSQNSSKPPSSDPPSAPPRPQKTLRGRPRGGQPGHPGHDRPLAPEDQVDTIVPRYPTQCTHCHAYFPPTLPDVAPVRRTQVWDLPERLIHITEYQQHTVACPCCGVVQEPPALTDLPPGVFGSGVIALTALLRRYRMSDRAIVDFWQTVGGLPISLGSVVRACQRMNMALEPLDDAIRAHILQQPALNVDETRWREQNQGAWLWVMTTSQATSFRIDRSRGRAAFDALVPARYRGVIGSDRYGVYHHLPNQRRQLCWAHLIRDLRACLLGTDSAQRWATAVLRQVRHLFAFWQWYRRALIDQIQLQVLLAPVRAAVADLLQQVQLDDRGAETLRADLLRHWDALWTFSRVDEVEPTNNAAERAIRPAVLWRNISFGTQSAEGSRFVERLLSVVTTCRQRGRDVFAVLRNAIQASWQNQIPPDLFATP
jgi:transposase